MPTELAGYRITKQIGTGAGSRISLATELSSGKTFAMGKVIEAMQRPTLVLAPNKTLAAQLFSEFKVFFPENAGRVGLWITHGAVALTSLDEDG